jgi:hypothetical protein
MTDLDKLIEAVEAGWISTDLLMAAIEHPLDMIALASFDGSLDAAVALHEALLPGWVWGRTEENIYVKDPAQGSRSTKWGGPSDKPARSFLLATLRAVRAKG